MTKSVLASFILIIKETSFSKRKKSTCSKYRHATRLPHDQGGTGTRAVTDTSITLTLAKVVGMVCLNCSVRLVNQGRPSDGLTLDESKWKVRIDHTQYKLSNLLIWLSVKVETEKGRSTVNTLIRSGIDANP